MLRKDLDVQKRRESHQNADPFMNRSYFAATIAVSKKIGVCESMKRKLFIQCVGFVIIALILLTSTAGAAKPIPTPSPTDQILAVVTDIQQKVNTVLTRISALQTSLDDISTNLTSLKGDVATIQTSSESISTSLTSLDSNVATIQTSSESISTNLTSLDSNVATIRTTTDAINQIVSSHPEPIGYEYYTTVMPAHVFDGADGPLKYWLAFSNGGDTQAQVTFTIYDAINIVNEGSGYSSSTMRQIDQGDMLISAKQSKAYVHEIPQNLAWDSANPLRDLKFPILMVKITSDSPSVAPRVMILNNGGTPIENYRAGDFQKVEIYP